MEPIILDSAGSSKAFAIILEIVERKFEGNTKLNESVRGWIQLSVIKLDESLLEKLNFLKLSVRLRKTFVQLKIQCLFPPDIQS